MKLADLPMREKRVLVRVDFNVPLDESLAVTSDARLTAALPTIRAILKAGGRPVLVSHLGRPKGADDRLRMAPVAARLQELLGSKVAYVRSCIGPEAVQA